MAKLIDEITRLGAEEYKTIPEYFLAHMDSQLHQAHRAKENSTMSFIA